MARKILNELRNNRKFLVFFVVFILCLFLSIIFLIVGVSKDDSSISINSTSNIDYSVYLKENSYYDSNKLGPNMKYIASLINYIDTNMNYNIASTDIMDYNYKYYIDATTRVYGDATKTTVLFEKTNRLLQEKELNEKEKDNISINENIKIDYNEFNSLIASFKTSFDLQSAADVSVVLHVTATAKNSNMDKSITIEDDSKLVIPLTEQTIDVNITADPANSYKVLKDTRNILLRNGKYVLIAIILFIVSMYALYEVLKNLGVLKFHKNSKYRKELNRILREYDLIIANVEHSIDENSYELIRVASFGELKDVHDNIGTPILYKELIKDQKSEFIIVNDNFLYKYILTNDDIEII